MDPLTHALVGLGVAALSGDELSLASPLQLGAVLGALAPDIDIVFQLYGDVPYLTHHRGSSHSIIAVVGTSAIIAVGLWLIMGGSPLGEIFVWTLLGALSHILLDLLNSYGAKILWPFSRKRYTLNLMVLADPVIIILFTGVIFWPGMPDTIAKITFWLALAYIIIRFYLRQRIYRMLWQRFRDRGAGKLVVMPAFISLWNWSFLIETEESFIVGEVRCFSLNPGIKKILAKCPPNELVKKAMKSKLGQVFQNFTPYYHISHYLEEGRHVVRFCDLRYYFREDFMHNATVIFDETQNIIDAVFQPYSKSRKIRIMG